MPTISREKSLHKDVVFVDGLPGCGKTLVSSIIASMERVELLSYAYEIENTCSLYHLDKIPTDAATTLIKLQTDLKIYNTMMGRDVNFRITDLSSAVNNHDTMRYLNRLIGPGDEKIPGIIQHENPILNFSTHNMISYSGPIFNALGDRCIFIEVVRHPLYMARQQLLNNKNLMGSARSFTIYFKYKDHELPYYCTGWEDKYLNSSHMERVIYFIDELTQRSQFEKKRLREKFNAKILTIPFELLVLNPDPWIQKITTILKTRVTDNTYKVLKEQHVPRDLVANGIDLEIYRRCGWTPVEGDTNERNELNIRRQDVAKLVNKDSLYLIDKLSKEYEQKYWSLENDKKKQY